jgi:hypothetical protein
LTENVNEHKWHTVDVSWSCKVKKDPKQMLY